MQFTKTQTPFAKLPPRYAKVPARANELPNAGLLCDDGVDSGLNQTLEAHLSGGSVETPQKGWWLPKLPPASSVFLGVSGFKTSKHLPKDASDLLPTALDLIHLNPWWRRYDERRPRHDGCLPIAHPGDVGCNHGSLAHFLWLSLATRLATHGNSLWLRMVYRCLFWVISITLHSQELCGRSRYIQMPCYILGSNPVLHDTWRVVTHLQPKQDLWNKV